MLRIGLSGGIGAGKSTVSATFAECGGIVLDGDVIAREVVEPGTVGLGKLVDAFGRDILHLDGTLNRPALATLAFGDSRHLATMNGIVHPLIAHRRSELIAAAATDAVVIEDIPLLVESQMAAMFPLVVIVHADEDVRVKRLIEHRGFAEADARARIAAQATEVQRAAAADVWLDNAGSAAELKVKALDLWHHRIQPFAQNLAQRRAAQSAPEVVDYDLSWQVQASRVLARLNTACGHHAVRFDHIGSTAVPGMAGRDVIDVQITVDSLATADKLGEALLAAGYPRIAHVTADGEHLDGRSTVAEFDHSSNPAYWQKRLHASADPGRPTNVHIRVAGWPNQQFAVLFVDWLTANPAAQADYRAVKRNAALTGAYAQTKEPWFLDAYRRAWAWADATGWRPR